MRRERLLINEIYRIVNGTCLLTIPRSSFGQAYINLTSGSSSL